MRPFILTLKNDFEEINGLAIVAVQNHFPVIIAIRMKVTTQNCNQIPTIYYLKNTITLISKKIFFVHLAVHIFFLFFPYIPDLSLSTQDSTTILISPIVQQATDLHHWSEFFRRSMFHHSNYSVPP